MKKVLNLLASVSLTTSGASTVVACGSSHIPTPEIQKLYDKLNGQTFTVENNNFWGNEHNYQQDLLQDLETLAHIPAQDRPLITIDPNTQPFPSPNFGDTYPVDLIIDHKRTAKVDVH